MKKIISIILAVMLALGIATTAAAQTVSTSVELPTRSILLIDKSGSMEDQNAARAKLASLNMEAFDTVRYFDSAAMTADEAYTGGADSSICEAVDAAVKGGFDHITVVTDGHQWPAEYSALGVYSDVDINILLTEEIDINVERFLDALEGSLSNSSLKVETLAGEEKVLLDEYQVTTLLVEMEVPDVEPAVGGTSEEAEESTTEEVGAICDHGKCRCLWWLALVLAILIAALFDLIHELIARKRDKEEKGEEQQPVAQQTQQTLSCTCQLPCRECPFEEYQREQAKSSIVAALQGGANLLLDTSGSMSSLRTVATAAAKKVNAENLIAFAENVNKVDADALDGLQSGGSTHGWEAVEMAKEQGYDDLVIVSDLQFNGRPFGELQLNGKFQKITAVVPKIGHSELVLEQLYEIADKVEVLYL